MSTKMITLKSSDDETFEVEEATAQQSQTLAHLIEDDCANATIPLDNVTSEILTKVIEYCKRHSGSNDTEEDLKKFDSEYVEGVEQSTVFDLILAANYLNIQNLLDLLTQSVADKIASCKDANEIREKFGIENDFTPEEEEQIRQETQWCFE